MVGPEQGLPAANAAALVSGGDRVYGEGAAPGAGHPRQARAQRGGVRHRHAQKIKIRLAIVAVVQAQRFRPSVGLFYSGLNQGRA